MSSCEALRKLEAILPVSRSTGTIQSEDTFPSRPLTSTRRAPAVSLVAVANGTAFSASMAKPASGLKNRTVNTGTFSGSSSAAATTHSLP